MRCRLRLLLHVPLPREGERLGEGASKIVRNPLTRPLPLAGERRKKENSRSQWGAALQE